MLNNRKLIILSFYSSIRAYLEADKFYEYVGLVCRVKLNSRVVFGVAIDKNEKFIQCKFENVGKYY